MSIIQITPHQNVKAEVHLLLPLLIHVRKGTSLLCICRGKMEQRSLYGMQKEGEAGWQEEQTEGKSPSDFV